MSIDLDVGYGATKTISGGRRATFPSVVGTPDKARFSLNGNASIVLLSPDHVQVVGGVRQSRFIAPREDRAWVTSLGRKARLDGCSGPDFTTLYWKLRIIALIYATPARPPPNGGVKNPPDSSPHCLAAVIR